MYWVTASIITYNTCVVLFTAVQPKKSKAERIEEKKAERRAKETEKTKVHYCSHFSLTKNQNISGNKGRHTRRYPSRKVTVTRVAKRVRPSSSKGIIWNDRLW